MLAVIAGITMFYGMDKTELVSVEGRTFDKAVVTEIVRDNIQENGTRSGEQQVKVRMTSGRFKNQELDATSSDGNLFGAAIAAFFMSGEESSDKVADDVNKDIADTVNKDAAEFLQ